MRSKTKTRRVDGQPYVGVGGVREGSDTKQINYY